MSELELTTAERILKAAGDIFGNKGFRETTIRVIAREAKVNIAAVNYHFGDKESLYGAVLEDVFHRGFTNYPADGDKGQNCSPEERLQLFIRSMFYRLSCADGWGGISGQGKLIAREMLDPSPTFEAVIEKYIKPHKDMLVSIIIDIMGHNPGPQKLMPCAISIIGQCIYYSFASKIIGKISEDNAPTDKNIERLADFVWTFSMGGIARVKDETSSLIRE